MSVDLHHLLILDANDHPLLFKSYHAHYDLGIQLHCYASLDFIHEKMQSKAQEDLGHIYSIYNSEG